MKLLIAFISLFTTQVMAQDITFTDTVIQMSTQGSAEEVVLHKRAAVYFLKHDHQNFAELKRMLQTSQLRKMPAKITVDADLMEIQRIVVEEKK